MVYYWILTHVRIKPPLSAAIGQRLERFENSRQPDTILAAASVATPLPVMSLIP
jgi:hypothetical protein